MKITERGHHWNNGGYAYVFTPYVTKKLEELGIYEVDTNVRWGQYATTQSLGADKPIVIVYARKNNDYEIVIGGNTFFSRLNGRLVKDFNSWVIAHNEAIALSIKIRELLERARKYREKKVRKRK